MSFENEKRCEDRFPVGDNSSCVFASPVLDDFGPVKLKNISLRGVGLVTNEKLSVGLMLAVKLANRSLNFSKTALARVVHVTPLPGNSYLIGCEWDTPFTYDEFKFFVM
jgi:PilZ domain